jgi:hypothetical protein
VLAFYLYAVPWKALIKSKGRTCQDDLALPQSNTEIFQMLCKFD